MKRIRVPSQKTLDSRAKYDRPGMPVLITKHITRGYMYRREDIRFRWIWILLCKTYAKDPHAFEKGCGKETMRHYFCQTSDVKYWMTHIQPMELRDVLNEACRRKWCRRVDAVQGQHCTQFFPLGQEKHVNA